MPRQTGQGNRGRNPLIPEPSVASGSSHTGGKNVEVEENAENDNPLAVQYEDYELGPSKENT